MTDAALDVPMPDSHKEEETKRYHAFVNWH